MTDLRLLTLFVAVYRAGSFVAAADAQGVAQSTVTKSIARLESQLGVKLFNRTTRSVEPTDAARQLLDKAESAVQAADVFAAEARLIAGGELGGIRVGAIALAAETVVIDGLARLADSHPKLEVEVVVGSSDIYRDLARGSFDLVIGDEANFVASAHSRMLRREPLTQEQLVFLHREGHPAGQADKLAELLGFPLAIPSRYFNENKLFATMAASSNPVVPRYRLNSLSACMTLAASTDVVTLAPESVARRLMALKLQDGLQQAKFDSEIAIKLALFTVANHAPTPAVRAFQRALGKT